MTAETVVRTVRPLTEKFRRVPIADLTGPKAGYARIYKDAWWFVTERDEILFYQVNPTGRDTWLSPQCNQDRRVLEYMPIEGCATRQLPIIYLPHRCEHD